MACTGFRAPGTHGKERHMRFKDLNKDEFRVNVQGGASDIVLANLYGVSDRTVSRWRQSLGLPTMYWESQRHPCGTPAAYTRGCRCAPCRRANREVHRVAVGKMRAKGLPPGDARHGTEAAYRNWACRCEPCRAVARERNREAWAKRHGDGPSIPRWTESEDFRVRVLPPKEAARFTGRSMSAVYQRRRKLGVSSSSTPRSGEGAFTS